MNRRDFLKSLLGGAACVAMPATAFASLEQKNRHRYYPGRGTLINPFDSAPHDFLQIRYDWLGTGRLIITRKQVTPATLKLTRLRVGIEDKGHFQDYVNPNEMTFEFPNFDINNDKIVLIKQGLPPKTVNLSNFTAGKYQPGRSLVFLIDLEEPRYQFIGEGKITFNGAEIQ